MQNKLQVAAFFACILACGIVNTAKACDDWDAPQDEVVVSTEISPDTTVTTDSDGGIVVSSDMGNGTTVTTVHRGDDYNNWLWGDE